MSYTIIDQKTEKHNFGVWPVTETVTTTLSLVNMGSGKFGLTYDSGFSGVKKGHVSGGPYEVTGNENIVVNENPKVVATISNFNKTESYISMHEKITVDIPIIGTKTIYDQTIGGEYSSETGWTVALDELGAKINSQKKSANV